MLGENHGTATHKLRKSLLYNMAMRLNELGCYRCGEQITSIDDFTIEHKIAWQQSDNPREMFFSLTNIAFSHFKCNIGAAVKTNKIYKDEKEKARANFKRYYSKKSEQFLERKRERYHNNKKK